MEKNKIDFIIGLLNNPTLTVKQRERVNALLVKELSTESVTEERVKEMIETAINSDEFQQRRKKAPEKKKGAHAPKLTADFLSLFNRRDGFKYLTHNYDSSGMSLSDMIAKVKLAYDEFPLKHNLPWSLRTLMTTFIDGGEWIDYQGKKCAEGYSTKSWQEWSEQNGNKHPITDIGGMEKTIQRFRHTIRIVAPDLQKMVEDIIESFSSYNFSLKNLDKADFYTNVMVVRNRLKEIIKDMADHDAYKDILIEYKPGLDGDYFTRQIRITQKGSYSAKPIDEVISKYNTEGGFFYENADKLRGYCNWSVESLWDEKPYRWNILKDTDTKETEEIEKDAVPGFTHILTFYYKD